MLVDSGVRSGRSLVHHPHALLEGYDLSTHGRERLGGHVPLDQLPPRPPRGVEHVLRLSLLEKMPQHPPVRVLELNLGELRIVVGPAGSGSVTTAEDRELRLPICIEIVKYVLR